jgi:hypothetical protein
MVGKESANLMARIMIKRQRERAEKRAAEAGRPKTLCDAFARLAIDERRMKVQYACLPSRPCPILSPSNLTPSFSLPTSSMQWLVEGVIAFVEGSGRKGSVHHDGTPVKHANFGGELARKDGSRIGKNKTNMAAAKMAAQQARKVLTTEITHGKMHFVPKGGGGHGTLEEIDAGNSTTSTKMKLLSSTSPNRVEGNRSPSPTRKQVCDDSWFDMLPLIVTHFLAPTI